MHTVVVIMGGRDVQICVDRARGEVGTKGCSRNECYLLRHATESNTVCPWEWGGGGRMQVEHCICNLRTSGGCADRMRYTKFW